MCRALIGHTDEVELFVRQVLGASSFAPCEGIGFLNRAGELEAGILFHNYARKSGVIELTAASTNRKWGTRSRLQVILGYPFDQLRCQMVLGRTAEDNIPALHWWRALGADEYRIPRLYGRDEAAIITTLTEEQWRSSRFNKGNPNG